MNEKVMMYFTNITEYIKKLDKKKRNLYFIIIGISLTAAILATLVLNYTDYVVLYRDLDTKECAAIVEKLDAMSVKNKVENENTIYVDKAEEPKVKLQLASEGYPKSSLNYDIFTNNVDFMTTDYEKTQYSLFQLQERLQASIKTLDNVKDAIVTITIPDNSLSVLDEDKIDPSASALLTLTNNVKLADEQIKGVEQLIAKSVPGLTEKNISIVDQTGAVLNGESDETVASTSSKIKTENEISKIYTNRILSILEPIYGKKKISIGVNVILDYSKKVTEKTEYSPSAGNAGVINGYDQTYQGANGGQTNGGVPGTEPNSEVPGYTTTTSGSKDGAISNQVSVDYVVNQVKEQIQKEGAELKDVTISVVIDKNNMSAEEITKVTGIIANSSGITKEKVALYNTEFTAANAAEPTGAKPTNPSNSFSLKELLTLKFYILYAGIGLLIIALLLVRAMLKSRKKKRELLNKINAEEEEKANKAKAFEPVDINYDITKITETKEQQLSKEIREFSLKSPQITALLIRTMLKGDID